MDTPEQELYFYMYNDSKNRYAIGYLETSCPAQVWPLSFCCIFSFPAAKNKNCIKATGAQEEDGKPYYAYKVNIGRNSPYYKDFYGVDGPRFWYFLSAVQTCAEDVKIDSMKIHLKNDDSELSYDEFGMSNTMEFTEADNGNCFPMITQGFLELPLSSA